MNKTGSFDVVMESPPPSKPSHRLNLLKNGVIAALAIVVIALAITVGVRSHRSYYSNYYSTPSYDSYGRQISPFASASHGNIGIVNGGESICLTEQCVAASGRLFKSMNLSADPCQDFNEFACGRFMKEFTLPEDKAKWTSFTPISELIFERGRILLEEDNSNLDWPVYQKARTFYRSCMNEDQLEALGVEPLRRELRELGGWPVLEGPNWQGDGGGNYLWYDKIYKLSRIGFGKDYLFTVTVETDDRNSSWRAIFLDQPNLGMSREYLIKGFEDPDVQHYFTYMKEAAVLLGANPDEAAFELKDVIMLEIELATLSAPREDRRNHTRLYNPVILGQFQSLPGHPPSWTNYIQQVLFENNNINADERIILKDPSYVGNVSSVLLNARPRVLANYLGWRVTKSVMEYLNFAARNIKQKYSRAIDGTNIQPARWKTCVEEVGFTSFSDASLRIPAASMYARRYFSPDAKMQMLDMIKYLSNAFLQILQQLDWMDQQTKNKAERKLKDMIHFIAYPEELLDQNKVERHHEGIDMRIDDYFGNTVRLTQWNRKFQFGRLRDRVDKRDWRDHALVAIVNAFYNPRANSIEFPAGILQGVFYDHQVPSYLNFGGIGSVIGHEITHGFHDTGRQYDNEGNLLDWWEDATKSRFVQKTQCMIEQYGHYFSPQVGASLNGITTQGENIADNGGVKEAFIAYEQWVKDHEEEVKLPGLDFTPRQLFWISWGQVWCSKYRDAALRNLIQTGSHAPGQFRIIGSLANLQQFSNTFNCQLGSPMNPYAKCSVW